MSPFLDHLAARVLRPGAAVRPRLIGVFEPPSVLGVLPVTPPFAVEQREIVPVPEVTVAPESQAPAAPAMSFGLERELVVRPQAGAPYDVHRGSPIPHRPIATPRPDRPPPEQRSPVTNPSDQLAGGEQPTVKRSSGQPQVDNLPRPLTAPWPITPILREESPGPSASAEMGPPPQPESDTASSAAPPRPPVPPQIIAPVVAPTISPKYAVAVAPVEAPPRIRPAVEPFRARIESAAPPPPPSSSSSSSAPTIRVTIGRIEVRAITSSISRPAPNERKSAISLDDYLQRQEERRR